MWKFLCLNFALSIFVEAERVTNPKKFPFVVSITKDDKHICSGSMLISSFIITSARCVQDMKADLLKVNIGSVDLSKPGDTYKVLDIKFHPNYNAQKYEYAAALLKVEDMKYKANVLPIGLSENETGGGVALEVVGWKEEGDKGQTTLLQYKMVTSLSNKACGNKLKTSVPDSVICTENDSAYDKDREYFSDVGGPVFDKATLVGVIVASNQPSKSKQPDINARISKMESWIIETVDDA